MTVKSMLAALALAGLGFAPISEPGRAGTVVLTTADGWTPVAGAGAGGTQPAAAPNANAAAVATAPPSAPDPVSAPPQATSGQDVAAMAAGPPQSRLRRMLSALIDFASTARR